MMAQGAEARLEEMWILLINSWRHWERGNQALPGDARGQVLAMDLSQNFGGTDESDLVEGRGDHYQNDADHPYIFSKKQILFFVRKFDCCCTQWCEALFCFPWLLFLGAPLGDFWACQNRTNFDEKIKTFEFWAMFFFVFLESKTFRFILQTMNIYLKSEFLAEFQLNALN